MTTSRFQRMVAISEQEYNQYQQRQMQQITHPLESHATTLFTNYENQGNLANLHARVQL